MTEAPKPRLKGSERIALGCLALGLAVAASLWFFLFPNMSWIGWVGVTLLVAAIAYPQMLQITANENIIDRGDGPNRT